MVLNMVSQIKQKQVANIIDLLKNSPNFVLIGFDKTPHKKLEEARKKLSPLQSKLRVIKNTLFEKAFNKILAANSPFLEFKKKFFPLKNSTAILTLPFNWLDSLKAFYEFTLQEKSLSFKSAILDGQIYDDNQILALAKLPSKNQLLTNIVISFKNPLLKFIFITRFSSYKLVYILKKLAEKK